MIRTVPCAALVLLLSAALPAAAQEQTGNLQGKVTDASGGVLPGVTVTISGPTLLGGSKTEVTTEAGSYRIVNIPIGTYTVSFDLTGFGTKAYQDIRIQAGTTYTVDAQLAPASIKETVTVTGEAPIIDTGETKVAFTFTQELMNTVPNARDPWAMITQAPGVITSSVNVGGTQTGNQPAFSGHGADSRQATYMLNGANVTDNTNNGGSQFYFDVDSFDEMQVEVNSHSAEVQTPGILLNIVPKSGTNNLHGTASGYFGNDSIQSDNVDDELRSRGVNRASNLQSTWTAASTLVVQSFTTRSSSGEHTGTRKSRTSLPERKTQTAVSRSIARTCGTERESELADYAETQFFHLLQSRPEEALQARSQRAHAAGNHDQSAGRSDRAAVHISRRLGSRLTDVGECEAQYHGPGVRAQRLSLALIRIRHRHGWISRRACGHPRHRPNLESARTCEMGAPRSPTPVQSSPAGRTT